LTISIEHPAGTPLPAGPPDAAVAQPSGAAAVPPSAAAVLPSAGVAGAVQPSLAEAAARPFAVAAQPSSVAGRPSAAVAVPERSGLPVAAALPHALLPVAGLAAVQAAIEVSARSQRRALAAQRRRVAGLRPSRG
jgi:hypothetical protein